MDKVRVHIAVNGIVQGVGFRPFIHKQITDHSLLGWIRNTAEGAELELEGSKERVERFLSELRTKSPRLALIETVDYEYLDGLVPYTEFRIIESRNEDQKDTLVSPDVAICEDCLREMRDPGNRRYRYPFLNCTNCGPRFTIVKEVPYDRKRTTMSAFPMCHSCEEEYRTITDRRYHAQPTCCPDCGPKLLLYEADGTLLSVKDKKDENELPLRKALDALKAGKIVCIKGLGGMHLACGIDDPSVPCLLRKRKMRDGKPFALMVRDAETARKYVRISEEEEKVLESHQRPIVLLEKKSSAELRETFGDAEAERVEASLSAVSGNGRLGIMLPYTPLHELLFEELDALVMTSANLSETPIQKDNEEALSTLRGIADGFLLNNRDIETRADDSVLWVYDGKPYFARRSRGYSPYPVRFYGKTGGADSPEPAETKPEEKNAAKACPSILAAGAEQKAVFCLTKKNHAFPSQHIGDLKNAETLAHYENQMRHFEGLFGIKPEVVVCDLHPDYLSTGYAEERAKAENLPLYLVQHHHAHMASCMEDNGLFENVIGIIWDGTGYGTDGTIWGSEFLIGNRREYGRYRSLPGMPLPGGEKAIHEPWRIALALTEEPDLTDREDLPAEIRNAFRRELISGGNPEKMPADEDAPDKTEAGEEIPGKTLNAIYKAEECSDGQATTRTDAGLTAEYFGVTEDEIRTAEAQRKARVNTPVSTGMGRLFDAKAAMMGICPVASYEGEGAVLLETAIGYPELIAKRIQERTGRTVPAEKLRKEAKAFHDALILWAVRTAAEIREKTGIDAVCLSGGTFQNQYLLVHMTEELRKEGFRVYTHRQVSCNDEGIALGQAAIAREGGETYVPCSAFQTR